MKILIVDDHVLLRDSLELLLQNKYGEVLTVMQARNARLALQLVDQHPDLDLMILDIDLPDMHGFQVIKTLGKNAPDLRVVALSGTVTQSFIQQCLALEICGFIPKTSSSKQILFAIDLVLSDGIYIPDEALPNTQLNTTHPILTNRQLDVLRLIQKGMSNDEIASILDVCLSTEKTHVRGIFARLGVKNRTEAVNEALLQNLL